MEKGVRLERSLCLVGAVLLPAGFVPAVGGGLFAAFFLHLLSAPLLFLPVLGPLRRAKRENGEDGAGSVKKLWAAVAAAVALLWLIDLLMPALWRASVRGL